MDSFIEFIAGLTLWTFLMMLVAVLTMAALPSPLLGLPRGFKELLTYCFVRLTMMTLLVLVSCGEVMLKSR